MEPMAALDASFLHVEDETTHMHIGMAAILEGPVPGQEEILAAVAAKLHLIPRYRQRVRFSPLAFARPMWADDPHFRLGYHVRRTALPAPGSEAELCALVGRLMEQKLDRDRPLWEMWIVEGMQEGRWGMVMKVHHCMVDGIAATDMLELLLDHEGSSEIAEPLSWEPAPEPRALGKLAATLRASGAEVADAASGAASAVRAPAGAAKRLAAFGSGMLSYSRVLRSPEPSSLNGPVGPHRRWLMARSSLDDVKRIKTAHGRTVNDVVLAAVARGFRELLQSRGEPVDDRIVRVGVPVSVRTEDRHGRFDNEVSMIFADLPVGAAEPLERLRLVGETMDRLKSRGEAYAGSVLTGLGNLAPASGWAIGHQIGTRTPQHSINGVVTNIPGPQRPWYFDGRRLLEVYPYVGIGGHMRQTVAIYSYDGQLNFGITGDLDHAADFEVLIGGIEAGLAELLESLPEQRAKAPASVAGSA